MLASSEVQDFLALDLVSVIVDEADALMPPPEVVQVQVWFFLQEEVNKLTTTAMDKITFFIKITFKVIN